MGKKAGESKMVDIPPSYWEICEIDPLGDRGRGGAHPILNMDGGGPLFTADFDQQSFEKILFVRNSITSLLDNAAKTKLPTAQRGLKRGVWYSFAAKFIKFSCDNKGRGLEYLDSPIGEIGKDVKNYVNRIDTPTAVKNSFPKTRQGIEKGIKKLIPEIRDNLLHQ